MKIYSDDPLVPYKTSTITPERSKAEIDGILAEWQVKDTHWHWDIPHNSVYVQFGIEETVNDKPMKVMVKVVCPTIWQREKPRARPPKLEEIDWKTSMRCMWWFIKSHLEMSYVLQSDKIKAFLPYIQTKGSATVYDLILPELTRYQALEGPKNEGRIIEVPTETETS